jgi:hypothetical protein
MKKKFAITYAGVPGSSKSPISNQLSPKFKLPIFNNDQLRYEIRENLMVNSINVPEALNEYNQQVKEIRQNILKSGTNIIFDSSVDRKWSELKEELIRYKYEWFIISFDYSKDFMANLYTLTGRKWALDKLNAYFKQHTDFLTKYKDDISLHLTDKDFNNRIQICINAVNEYITSDN